MVRNPAKTIVTLEEKIRPYWKKLKPSLRVWYEKEKQQIYSLFDKEAFQDIRKLSELYLLGYNTELADLWSKKDKGGQEDECIEE